LDFCILPAGIAVNRFWSS